MIERFTAILLLWMINISYSVAQTSFGIESHVNTVVNFEKNNFVSYGSLFSVGPIMHLKSQQKVSFQVSVLFNRESGSTLVGRPQIVDDEDLVRGADEATEHKHVIYDLKLPVAVHFRYDNSTALNLGLFMSHQLGNKMTTEGYETKNSQLIKDLVYGLACGYGYSRKRLEVLFSVEYNLNDRFEELTERNKINTLKSGINFRYYLGER